MTKKTENTIVLICFVLISAASIVLAITSEGTHEVISVVIAALSSAGVAIEAEQLRRLR